MLRSQTTHFRTQHVPRELWLLIFDYCDYATVYKLQGVNLYFANLLNDDEFDSAYPCLIHPHFTVAISEEISKNCNLALNDGLEYLFLDQHAQRQRIALYFTSLNNYSHVQVISVNEQQQQGSKQRIVIVPTSSTQQVIQQIITYCQQQKEQQQQDWLAMDAQDMELKLQANGWYSMPVSRRKQHLFHVLAQTKNDYVHVPDFTICTEWHQTCYQALKLESFAEWNHDCQLVTWIGHCEGNLYQSQYGSAKQVQLTLPKRYGDTVQVKYFKEKAFSIEQGGAECMKYMILAFFCVCCPCITAWHAIQRRGGFARLFD